MSQTPTAPPPVAVPQAGVVDADRPCVQCSYNLRGLPMSGHCPECGTAVQQSLRGILLQFASADYLATVRSGLGLVLNGILLYIILQVAGVAVAVVTSGAGGSTTAWTLISTFAALGVQGMILFGYWRYTQPDPGFVGTDLPDTPRKVVRFAVAAQAVTAVLQTALSLGVLATVSGAGAGAGAGLVALGILVMVAGLAALAAWIAGFFGIMLYTQWMAKRIPDQYIVNRARLYLWLLPVIAVVGIVIIIGPLIALILYWNLLDRMRKHLKSIIATGEPASLPARFG